MTHGGTSKAISGKITGTWSYRVRACNAAGCGSYSAIKTTQVTRPPTTVPTLTAPSSSDTGTYTVSWTGAGGATRYELEERLGSGSWSKIHDAATTSKARQGQAVGSWSYRVRACNAAGCGTYSAIKTTQVTRQIPSVPPAPSVSNLGWGCQVTWASSAGATSYQVNTVGSLVYDGPDTSVILSGACGSTYEVRACNAGGCSSWSPPGHGGGVIERHEGEGE